MCPFAYPHIFTAVCTHTDSQVHGLIFLYKWRQGEEPQGSIVEDSRLEEIFFSKQVSNKSNNGGRMGEMREVRNGCVM